MTMKTSKSAPNISVIISNYNNACYLHDCLDSVFVQQGVTFECTVVDDCSTDETVFDIFDEYSKRYPDQFRLVRHKKNMGCGQARQDGLRASTGDYIIFLDSDDYWTHSLYLKTLYDLAVESGSDLVRSGWVCGDEELYEYGSGTIVDRQKRIDVIWTQHQLSLFSVLFRRETIWDDMDYCTRPYIEDTPSYVAALLKANSITYTDKDCGYYYRDNPTSVTHTASSLKKDLFGCLSALDMLDECDKYGVTLTGKLSNDAYRQNVLATFQCNCLLKGWKRSTFSPYEEYYDELMIRGSHATTS